MAPLPHCPSCNSEHTYQDGILLICPECAYEWCPEEAATPQESETGVIIDCKIDGIGAMKLTSMYVKKT
jgi:uncharacterized Zn ribbon protein